MSRIFFIILIFISFHSNSRDYRSVLNVSGGSKTLKTLDKSYRVQYSIGQQGPIGKINTMMVNARQGFIQPPKFIETNSIPKYWRYFSQPYFATAYGAFGLGWVFSSNATWLSVKPFSLISSYFVSTFLHLPFSMFLVLKYCHIHSHQRSKHSDKCVNGVKTFEASNVTDFCWCISSITAIYTYSINCFRFKWLFMDIFSH